MSEAKVVPRILIAEKDRSVRGEIQQIFRSYGYETWVVANGKDALKIINSLKPDAVILDMDLPELSGLDVCRELRQTLNNWLPVVLISVQSDEIEAVLGMELGADDYMVKPLRFKELVARVKAVLRRGQLCCLENETKEEAVSALKQGKYRSGELVLDPVHLTLYKGKKPVELTRKEFELMFFLMKNKGKAFTRQHLITALTVNDQTYDERIIDVFVSRIRRQIEPNRRNPLYIKTVRNVGYMLKDVPIKHKSYQ
ncbi:response regulator transcription factor [Salipaludibacillus agaradhaerens]|uniref:response regulator transcription factor n=1 Tax=Salipaludibacillus agaradhaerens TaxID=76935 RepID=UPI0021507337|nr:response regulator transcription factor [Salipaludibacillus agaradhaerens]MCR6107427.1 response regulator transcription factor [Salipaludibacillus agaradhaerens]MCR6119456.1 response regulator transcription factor [Salipaludibacillus agaradhaerens]UJW58482.1 response regulator transcription factor [Bacillus sp. A116_S68]